MSLLTLFISPSLLYRLTGGIYEFLIGSMSHSIYIIIHRRILNASESILEYNMGDVRWSPSLLPVSYYIGNRWNPKGD